MTASEREAHILGLIDTLTGEIGAYLTQFATDDQASSFAPGDDAPQGKMRGAWTEFVDAEYANAPEVWRMP